VRMGCVLGQGPTNSPLPLWSIPPGPLDITEAQKSLGFGSQQTGPWEVGNMWEAPFYQAESPGVPR
jgi:hypothetical protein